MNDSDGRHSPILPLHTPGKTQDYTDESDNSFHEDDTLLPSSEPKQGHPQSVISNGNGKSKSKFGFGGGKIWTSLAFIGGVLACLVVQAFLPSNSPITHRATPTPFEEDPELISNPNAYGGPSREVHHYPPTTPTNAIPTYFPTNVGYAGATPTGAEAAMVVTAPAYPLHTGAPNLLAPAKLPNFGPKKDKSQGAFDMFRHWGNLSPWYSIPSSDFGLNDTSPEPPAGCRVTALHFLHRHGARYPTSHASFGGPSTFVNRLRTATETGHEWKASGDLEFLNDWTYKLGGELLTPFGRQQLFDLGVSLRLKYGFLLQNFTEANRLPVFRTESQDRMLHSALNFAIGFFGYPFQDQYLQSITIEANGFNNTLSPYKTCPHASDPKKSDRSIPYLIEWTDIYLKDATARLSPLIKGAGYDIGVEDVYIMQQICAYETVAVGYSKFCELFTEEEWLGFEYSMDIYFWYTAAFGSPTSRIQGIGYVQELVARLTETRIAVHNTSTNGTLDDDPVTFPFGNSLYVDATHETVMLNIITALNLTNFAKNGPLPSDHIPADRTFVASQLAPFANNIQFQLLSCSSTPDPQIRIIINDGVTPLTGVNGCPASKDGACAVSTFTKGMSALIQDADWEWECHGEWDVPAGRAWNTTTGSPPRRGEKV